MRLLARSSHIAPPQVGQDGIPGCGATVAAGAAPDASALAAPAVASDAERGGQITPSHSLFLHL